MLKPKDTGLEEFSFGSESGDTFYLLVNKHISPDGINLDRLRLSDPRNFDSLLNDLGCIIMINDMELAELRKRGDVDENNIHLSLYALAVREGLIN